MRPDRSPRQIKAYQQRNRLPSERCGPTGKLMHRSQGAAEEALKRAKAEGRDECRAYMCPFCRHYHLTRARATTTNHMDGAA